MHNTLTVTGSADVVVQAGSISGGVTVVAAPVKPAQLPSPPGLFVDRDPERTALRRALDRVGSGPTAVPISVVSGIGGIGKTCLAVHWSHHHTDRFPDGQLYVDLHGFHPADQPLDPAVAIRSFLDAFRVAPQSIPVDLDAQASLYRSLVADKRVLILLDNARDSDQVVPLLPGTPTAFVLVTSRRRLPTLSAAFAARQIPLGALSTRHSTWYLVRQWGRKRTADERGAVAALADHCAGLPLALSIVAARALISPSLPLGPLAEELRAGVTDLDAGDSKVTIGSVFSWSYRALPPESAALFRATGLHPGRDWGIHSLAALLARDLDSTRRAMRELVSASMLDEHRRNRFKCHDLLRTYAVDLATAGTGDDRAMASSRLLDHYLHTSVNADRVLKPHRGPIDVGPVPADVPVLDFADYDAAAAWFTAEYPNLVLSVEHAAETGKHVHAWQLAWSMTTFCGRFGHWHDWLRLQRIALASSTALGDREAQARSRRAMGNASCQLGRHADALEHHAEARALWRRIGDANGEAGTCLALCWVYERSEQHPELLHVARQAADLYRQAGNRLGRARALNYLGWALAHTGEHAHAVAHCEEALAVHREFGDVDAEAHALDSISYAYFARGDHALAVHHYRQSADLYREVGDHYYEAATLVRLGDAQDAAGDHAGALVTWTAAGRMLDQLGHPDAEDVRRRVEDGR